MPQEEDQQAVEAEQESTEDVMADLGLDTEAGEEEPTEDGDEETLQEILDMLSEDADEEVLEEELVVDTSSKKQVFQTDEGAREYEEALSLAQD